MAYLGSYDRILLLIYDHGYSIMLPSVVKVYCNSSSTSYIDVWRKEPSVQKTGTASLVEHNGTRFILTNEHVVRDNSQIYVTVEGCSKQFTAKVRHRDYRCDLALLEIVSDKFAFEGLVSYLPLQLELPSPGTKLATQGFPTGGQGFCTTEGVVSRNESSA